MGAIFSRPTCLENLTTCRTEVVCLISLRVGVPISLTALIRTKSSRTAVLVAGKPCPTLETSFLICFVQIDFLPTTERFNRVDVKPKVFSDACYRVTLFTSCDDDVLFTFSHSYPPFKSSHFLGRRCRGFERASS